MVENEIKETRNYEEHIIVTPRDVPIPHYVQENSNYAIGFFCPKCDSSLIYMPEEYTKNNFMNSIKPESDPNVMPGHQVNEGWDKIVLKCDNCKWADLVMKFMKEKQDYSSTIYDEACMTKPKWFHHPTTRIPSSYTRQANRLRKKYGGLQI